MENKKENIGVILLMSVMEAIGILTFVCGLAGVDLFQMESVTVAGLLVGIGGVLFGILLIRDYIRPGKEH